MHHAYVPPGKKQLNQLITFLDKGGNAKESRAGDALRTVRAKREADEAGESVVRSDSPLAQRVFVSHYLDKEYRKGVHWLETLRLRRIKILESGYHVGHYSPTTYLRLYD